MSAQANRYALEGAAQILVQRLGGRWHARGAMCLCPAHADRTPSLSVRIGHTSLLFKCFAGCRPDAVLAAIRNLGLDVPAHPGAAHVDRTADPESTEPRLTSQLARDLWDHALPLERSPGDRYLATRMVATSSRALRWHQRIPLGRGRAVGFRPGILAAVVERDRVIAVQRLFVDPRTARLAEDLAKAKLTLGRPLTGAVPLDDAGPTLGLAEGIENALSAARLLEIPVWATLGAERLHQIAIPAGVERLVLLADNDLAGHRAERRARAVYAAQGLVVTALWPWHGQNDWNDVLMKGGKGEGTGCGRRSDWQASAASGELK